MAPVPEGTTVIIPTRHRPAALAESLDAVLAAAARVD